MENNEAKMEQLLMEMNTAIENNDEALYKQLLEIKEKLEKEIDSDEDQ